VINNEAFVTILGARLEFQGQLFPYDKYASHYLTLPQFHMLVGIHFKEGPSVKFFLMRVPKLFWLLQKNLQHFLHYKVISANVGWGFLF